MNFTREPIIETVISPKEGFKLSIRSSKGENPEEVLVEAIEIVSFGSALFYRSLEKPKCFLVPVSDYEVFEVKETRVVLKNANIERTIKIGGGRDAPPRPPREEPAPYVDEEERPSEEAPQEQRQKRDRRRRHRRRSDDRQPMQQQSSEEGHDRAPAENAVDEGGGAKDETKVSSSMFTHLFPPPTTLISETISRYKDVQHAEGNSSAEKVEKPSDQDTLPSEHPSSNEES